MKVKEFIETLKAFNEDAEVILVNGSTGMPTFYDENPGWGGPDTARDPENIEECIKEEKLRTEEVCFFFNEDNKENNFN